jgi:hypothetical protein
VHAPLLSRHDACARLCVRERSSPGKLVITDNNFTAAAALRRTPTSTRGAAADAPLPIAPASPVDRKMEPGKFADDYPNPFKANRASECCVVLRRTHAPALCISALVVAVWGGVLRDDVSLRLLGYVPAPCVVSVDGVLRDDVSLLLVCALQSPL